MNILRLILVLIILAAGLSAARAAFNLAERVHVAQSAAMKGAE